MAAQRGLFRRFAAVFATGLAFFFAAGGTVVAAAFFAGITGGQHRHGSGENGKSEERKREFHKKRRMKELNTRRKGALLRPAGRKTGWRMVPP